MAKRTVQSDYYRRLYLKHHGEIPKDDEGRTYDIHHIDHNHKNNDLSNLKAVSIKEHYDIHYVNGDYQACLRIAQRLNFTSEELSKLATLNNIKRIESGNHHFVGENNPTKLKIKNGTHNFLTDHPGKTRLENRTHNFLTNHPNGIQKTCPHCGKIGGGRIMKRWHFDNCKEKKDGN
jgi:hypothetical protein